MGPSVQKQLEGEREKVEARLQQVSDGIHHTLKSNFDLVADKVKKAHEDLKGLQVRWDTSVDLLPKWSTFTTFNSVNLHPLSG